VERPTRALADTLRTIAVLLAIALALAPLLVWWSRLGAWPHDSGPLLRALGRGLAMGLVVGVVAIAIAWPIARSLPGAVLLGWALVGPLPRSLGVLALGLPPGPLAVGLATLAGAVPWTALLVQVRLHSRPRAWIEAAADLGASPWQRFVRIDLPFVRPALAIAATWTVLQGLGDATTYEIAGGGKLYTPALLLRDAVLEDDDAGLVSVALAASTIAALPAAWALTAVLGRTRLGTREPPMPGRGAMRWVGRWLAIAAALPILALVVPATAPLGPGDALLVGKLPTTAAIVGAAALLGGMLGTIAAIGLHPRRAGSFALLLLPAVVPAVVYGVAALELGAAVGLGPGAVLTVAGLLPTTTALAFVVVAVARPRVPTVLVDAAADLGAGPWARGRAIWLPLLGPAIAAAVVLAGAWAINEAALVAFTSGPGGSTLAVAMTIVARGAEAAVVPRWALVQAGLAMVAVVVARRMVARGSSR